ncbi:MAG: preprotein translocase subunit SecE [Alphaproteobacteria bacterium]|nr:preprotein translocase subunit SecE [Alphaproteobacteria bacterium]
MSTNQSSGSTGGGAANAPKPSLGEFFRQVRQEANKVSWPTRKETLVTTGMVFAMSILAAVFFFVVDWIVSHAVRLILGFGG